MVQPLEEAGQSAVLAQSDHAGINAIISSLQLKQVVASQLESVQPSQLKLAEGLDVQQTVPGDGLSVQLEVPKTKKSAEEWIPPRRSLFRKHVSSKTPSDDESSMLKSKKPIYSALSAVMLKFSKEETDQDFRQSCMLSQHSNSFHLLGSGAAHVAESTSQAGESEITEAPSGPAKKSDSPTMSSLMMTLMW